MDVDFKAPTDTRACIVADMVVLPSSNLLVADFNNNSVKVIDVHTGHLFSYAQLPGDPRSLCLLPDDRAAVSLPFMRNIYIFDVSTAHINFLDSVDVERYCIGLAYMNDAFLAGFYEPQGAILALINIKGNVLKSVSSNNAGKTLFNCPFCIRVTTENNASSIYVSDFITRTITRLSEELKVLQWFQYSTQPGPGGLVPAGAGQLLASDCTGLWVLDTNTGERKKLLDVKHKDGNYCVAARVAFCPRLERVYINFRYLADRESDFINVYEIS